MKLKHLKHLGWGGVAVAALVLAACASAPPASAPAASLTKPPQLSAAMPGTLKSCEALAQAALPNTRIASAMAVSVGGLTSTGIVTPFPAHCVVRGFMNERIGPVDGKPYAIGFEMRLPQDWNGRFFYQANGGVDGNIHPAIGNIGGGAPTTTALHMGFATISSDAGHPAPNPFFGLDPQARVDYGYGAVQSLTPIAKQLIANAYGKAPDRSYLGGCSNGGRHAMVAAERMAAHYDGILAGNPGFRLPLSAVAQLDKVKAYASVSDMGTNGLPNIQTAVSPAEYQLVAKSVLAKCDALDGAADGMVQRPQACQAVFDLNRDVPTCAPGVGSASGRSGECLNAERKAVLARVFEGPKLADGKPLYHPFWFDPGIAGNNWRFWHYTAAQNLDPGAVAFIFSTPPSSTASYFANSGLRYALAADVQALAKATHAISGVYAQSAMSYMTPPAGKMTQLQQRGAKIMLYHGTADGVFSTADTVRWYDELNTSHAGQAADFARLFVVPGMNHCSAGPSADQFNMLQSLVSWVEQGAAPERVIAQVRGAGSNVVNTELPPGWSATRTRPLCPHPKTAQFVGGDVESAASFVCK